MTLSTPTEVANSDIEQDLQEIFSEFLIPKSYDIEKIGNNTIKVELQPLERGFGHTIGFAMRRVLLSSMRGSAIIKAIIDGVSHEYSTLDGIQEDVLQILMQLKLVCIKQPSAGKVQLKLDVQGSELDVIEGAKTMLSAAKIGLIYIEWQVVPLYENHHKFYKIAEILAKYDYKNIEGADASAQFIEHVKK